MVMPKLAAVTQGKLRKPNIIRKKKLESDWTESFVKQPRITAVTHDDELTETKRMGKIILSAFKSMRGKEREDVTVL